MSSASAQRGPVVAVSSNKGGVGKTTLATNLAIYTRALREDLPFLGSLPLDPALEQATGWPEPLLQTSFAAALRPIVLRALGRDS